MYNDDITADLHALRIEIEEITQLPSRWSGRTVLLESQDSQLLKGKAILAEKQWECDIVVNVAIATEPIRWRTLIHEMLHSVSVGLNEADYRRFRGWEEAVVEPLQRSLRPQILDRLGVDVPENLFVQVERFWAFNPYIEAMESLRQHVMRQLPQPINRHGLRRSVCRYSCMQTGRSWWVDSTPRKRILIAALSSAFQQKPHSWHANQA